MLLLVLLLVQSFDIVVSIASHEGQQMGNMSLELDDQRQFFPTITLRRFRKCQVGMQIILI